MTPLDLRPLVEPLSAAQVREFRRSAPWQFGVAAMGPFVVAIILVPCAIVFTAVLAGQVSSRVPVGLTLGIGALGIAAIVAAAVTAQRSLWRHLFRMSRFAERNVLAYTPMLREPPYDALIFRAGMLRVARDVLESDADRPFGVGTYRHRVGSGNSRHVRRWGYAWVALDRELPHLVLDARANDGFLGRSDLAVTDDRRLDPSKVLRLEGDFDRHFRLYAPEGRAVDTLSVLTPDVMGALIDEASGWDAEIVGDRMWFFRPGRLDLDAPEEWRLLERLLGRVGAEAAHQSATYTDATSGGDQLDIRVSRVRRFLRRNAWSLLIAAGFAIQLGWGIVVLVRGI